MTCLLAAATSAEIAPFLQYYRDTPKLLHTDISIDVLITGAGLTATTYHLSRQVHIRRPDLVIQAGIAGSYDRKIAPGTVVAVKQDRIADEGVMEKRKLRTVFEMGLGDPNQFPWKKGWLINTGVLLERSKLKMVRGISVNQVSTNPGAMAAYTGKFNPTIESMEGAALHYVCLMENLPFLQMRSVSNYIGERNKKNWEIKTAVNNLNLHLVRLLESL